MNEQASGSEHYPHLQRRLRKLLVALEHRLPRDDRQSVAELIDADECGLALQTIGDALAEASIPGDDIVREEMVRLAREMGMPREFAARFRPTMAG